MKWRRLFRVLHRDIGYLLFGLVLAYSISGVAVNHVDDWNPNYSVTVTEVDVGALPAEARRRETKAGGGGSRWESDDECRAFSWR